MDAELVGAAGGGFKFNERPSVSRRQYAVGGLGGLTIRVDTEGAGRGRVAANR